MPGRTWRRINSCGKCYLCRSICRMEAMRFLSRLLLLRESDVMIVCLLSGCLFELRRFEWSGVEWRKEERREMG